MFVVSTGHLFFRHIKQKVSGGESLRKGEGMRGHSPFVQERKGDGMGHKPTPCCGCKDTKRASFTSAPVDDSKKVLFTLML